MLDSLLNHCQVVAISFHLSRPDLCHLHKQAEKIGRAFPVFFLKILLNECHGIPCFCKILIRGGGGSFTNLGE